MKELLQAFVSSRPGLTSKEIARQMGAYYPSARAQLSRLKRSGRLSYIDGAYYPVMPFIVRSGGKVLCSPR